MLGACRFESKTAIWLRMITASLVAEKLERPITDKKIDPGQMGLLSRLLILQIKGLDFRSHFHITPSLIHRQGIMNPAFFALKFKTVDWVAVGEIGVW